MPFQLRWSVLVGLFPCCSVRSWVAPSATSSCAVRSLECCLPLGSVGVNVIVSPVSHSNCGCPPALSGLSCSPFLRPGQMFLGIRELGSCSLQLVLSSSADPNLLWRCTSLPHCFAITVRAKNIIFYLCLPCFPGLLFSILPFFVPFYSFFLLFYPFIPFYLFFLVHPSYLCYPSFPFMFLPSFFFTFVVPFYVSL